MAAAGADVVQFDHSEIVRLSERLSSAQAALLAANPNLKGAIFPAFVHEANLTEALFDLLILFFDRVLIYIDTFNIPRRSSSRILEKLDACIENGYVQILEWSGEVITPLAHRESAVLVNPVLPTPNPYWSIHECVEKLAALRTQATLSVMPRGSVRGLAQRFLHAGLLPLFDPESAPPDYVAMRVLNRLNGFTILCDLLGVHILTDAVLSGFRKLQYRTDAPVLATVGAVLLDLEAWYDEKMRALPRFTSPETLLRFRQDAGRKDFFDCILREYRLLSQEQRRSHSAVIREVKQRLDRHLLLAKRITGSTYQRKTVLLTGLVATLGGLMGGTGGAVLGGIGARVAALAAEWFDRRMIEHWTSYFLEPR